MILATFTAVVFTGILALITGYLVAKPTKECQEDSHSFGKYKSYFHGGQVRRCKKCGYREWYAFEHKCIYNDKSKGVGFD